MLKQNYQFKYEQYLTQIKYYEQTFKYETKIVNKHEHDFKRIYEVKQKYLKYEK